MPIEWRTFMEQVARLLGRKKTRKIMIPEILGRALAEFSELRIRAFGKKAIFNRDKFNEMKFPAWVCSGEKIDAQLHFQPRTPLPRRVAGNDRLVPRAELAVSGGHFFLIL